MKSHGKNYNYCNFSYFTFNINGYKYNEIKKSINDLDLIKLYI